MTLPKPKIRLSFRTRVVLVVSLACFVAGAALAVYRYYNRPVVLTVAVGTLDGEARSAAQLIASRLVRKQADVRIKVVDATDVGNASAMFEAGKTDLAVIRADIGDHARGRAVAVLGESVALLLVPQGSGITSVAGLQGRKIGVAGADLNRPLLDAIRKEYNLGELSIVPLSLADLRHGGLSPRVDAVLAVVPLTSQYISLVKGVFSRGANASPKILAIEAAGAIADVNGAYESFDVPEGTFRGSPPDPADDVTTLRTAFYLVAAKDLGKDVIADLTKELVSARDDLVSRQPGVAGITAPDLDPDAYIPVHPGAAEYYNDTQPSFMDKYGDAIYLTPMALGGLASIIAAAWRFIGDGRAPAETSAVASLYALPRRIGAASEPDELDRIEAELDEFVSREFDKHAAGGEDALDLPTLNSIAQRLESLIRHRRAEIAVS